MSKTKCSICKKPLDDWELKWDMGYHLECQESTDQSDYDTIKELDPERDLVWS